MVDELAIVLLARIGGLGGAYIGVATDQNYTMAAAARSELLFLMDYDAEVGRIHRIYHAFMAEAATPAEFPRARADHIGGYLRAGTGSMRVAECDLISGRRAARCQARAAGAGLPRSRLHPFPRAPPQRSQDPERAGERQVKDVNVSFVGASAPIVQGTTFIFVKEPY